MIQGQTIQPTPPGAILAGALIVALGVSAAGEAGAAAIDRTGCPHVSSERIARAYRDSTWVVRARFAAADDHWSGAGESWTLIHTQTLHAFKGRPPPRLDILTRGDDAGPWLDGGALGALGQEYLLFLRPAPRGAPIEGVAMVSDGCGASKPWSHVSHGEARSLEAPGHFARPQRIAMKSEGHARHVRVASEEKTKGHKSKHWRWPEPLRGLFDS
ncbi:MAG TPA: hypothetical protein VGG92_20120 [Caulobacteraceae bacterium]|jgi:hypothetical protein